LKNRAKSGDMAVLQLTFRNMSLGKCPKIDPATGVSNPRKTDPVEWVTSICNASRYSPVIDTGVY